MSDTELWESELAGTGQVRLRTNHGKNVLALLGCLAFAVVGLALIGADSSVVRTIVGYAAVVFFGVIGIPALVVQLFRPRDVVVTPTEVRLRNATVPWNQVLRVEYGAISGQTFAVLRLTDEGAVAVQQQYGPLTRLLDRANSRLTQGPSVALPAQLKADRRELTVWLVSVHQRALAQVWHAVGQQTSSGPESPAAPGPSAPPTDGPGDEGTDSVDHTRFMPGPPAS
ncbi:STM3941 family protein [Georgenia subflava]|uniref:PH domain-containing protein n=1 Tax=Georgenia subflava TaxID=1622177 RepID=A0A6N7EJM4_9MICO|nr:STM3941 family protein [Georgenia subflava]MPV37258.1 hypothetical protein [Georgenia subflava]